ncbi:hypothetical protein LS73_004375 [Helicobacter muridarum]|uniref:Uncharacterized protein n=1 Tax=Helicobacter muridarum TaxID=216 RepID=A0A099TYV0_9HELI|nr:hypothetical protein [Helicobacter muridarum]TLE00650.1 hypothetical protein LS73_004375 [Helicobacter muridarum]STQ85668.1 Uncharacterised protein [Helicobacter muridarum]
MIKNPYKLFYLCVLCVPIPFAAGISILLYLYDPMQIWHKPYWRDITFFDYTGHGRSQARGVIDFYQFDSIIMGSSMLFKSDEKLADEKLKGTWVNFSTGGASNYEKAVILNYGLKHKNIKQVIMSIEGFWQTVDKDARDFKYIYDENPINDIKLYLNYHFISCALIWSLNQECVGNKNTYRQRIQSSDTQSNTKTADTTKLDTDEEIRAWLTRNQNKKTKKLYDDLRNFANNPFTVAEHEIDIKRHEAYLNDNILFLAKQNPNTKFYFVIPPYTRLTFRLKDEIYDLYEWEMSLRLLVEMTKDMENVGIYGFDSLDYPNRLANYFDTTHYGRDMNEMQIDSIATNKHRITTNNVESYIQETRQKIESYDIARIAKILDMGLKD